MICGKKIIFSVRTFNYFHILCIELYALRLFCWLISLAACYAQQTKNSTNKNINELAVQWCLLRRPVNLRWVKSILSKQAWINNCPDCWQAKFASINCFWCIFKQRHMTPTFHFERGTLKFSVIQFLFSTNVKIQSEYISKSAKNGFFQYQIPFIFC